MRSWNRNFCLLAFAVFSVGMFFGIYFALFFNFIENRFAIEAHELGYMEALREVPGFLNALYRNYDLFCATNHWWNIADRDGGGHGRLLPNKRIWRTTILLPCLECRISCLGSIA